MKPINVSNHNKETVFFNLYGYKPKEISKDFHKINITFNVGDKVRISKNKFVFDKGYTRNYTREIFKISQVLLRPIPVYKIVDNTDSEIKGVFYSQELLKVSK